MLHTEWTGGFTTDSRSFTAEVKFKFLVVPKEVALKTAKDYFFWYSGFICSFLPVSQIAKIDLEKKTKWGPRAQCCHQVVTLVEQEVQQLRTRTITGDTKSTEHTMALSIPASESQSARNTLVRARSINALCIWTSSWGQAFVNVFKREDKRKYQSKP